MPKIKGPRSKRNGKKSKVRGSRKIPKNQRLRSERNGKKSKARGRRKMPIKNLMFEVR